MTLYIYYFKAVIFQFCLMIPHYTHSFLMFTFSKPNFSAIPGPPLGASFNPLPLPLLPPLSLCFSLTVIGFITVVNLGPVDSSSAVLCTSI